MKIAIDLPAWVPFGKTYVGKCCMYHILLLSNLSESVIFLPLTASKQKMSSNNRPKKNQTRPQKWVSVKVQQKKLIYFSIINFSRPRVASRLLWADASAAWRDLYPCPVWWSAPRPAPPKWRPPRPGWAGGWANNDVASEARSSSNHFVYKISHFGVVNLTQKKCCDLICLYHGCKKHII